MPKPSLFCNVQRDVASLPFYSKLNSKRNHWNSHVLPRLLLIGSCQSCVYELFTGCKDNTKTISSLKLISPFSYSWSIYILQVLCFMTVFTFMLPCDNGAKVAIGLTVFLSLYVLQLAIAENIPEADSLPLISKCHCKTTMTK